MLHKAETPKKHDKKQKHNNKDSEKEKTNVSQTVDYSSDAKSSTPQPTVIENKAKSDEPDRLSTRNATETSISKHQTHRERTNVSHDSIFLKSASQTPQGSVSDPPQPVPSSTTNEPVD